MLPSQLLAPLVTYALLTAGLVGVVFAYRTTLVLLRRSAANSWPRSKPKAEPLLVQRAHDAHKNCVETFPLFLVASLVVASNGSVLTDWGWCISWLVGIRILQSAIHVAGTQPILVFIRGLLYVGQLLGLALISVAGVVA